jgi:hypothetical protein
MSNDLDLSVLYPKDYVCAADLGGKEVTVTVTGVRKANVPMSGNKKEPAVVVSMKGTRKKFLANKTNGLALALLLSPAGRNPNAADWIGKRIVLRPEIDTFGRETVACIRVVGSPDANPEDADEFARVWDRGDRKGGALAGRLKRALGIKITKGGANPPPPPKVQPMAPEPDGGPDMFDPGAEETPNADNDGR